MMRLGFHYHIPACTKQATIYMPGSQGRFIDNLAQNCDQVICFLHSPLASEEGLMDHPIQSSNVKLVNIGPHSSIPQRAISAGKITKKVRDHCQELDILLIRGPSPMLSKIAGACQHLPIALLIVGDYLAGVDGLPQPKWRKEIIRLWSWFNAHQQLKFAKNSLTFVNSHILYSNYLGIVPHLMEIQTTTLSKNDIFEREDTCLSMPIHLLYTGRMDRSKGLLDILEAVHRLTLKGLDLVFNLVGMEEKGDPVVQELFNRAQELGINDKIVFHGYKPLGSELFSHYKDADIYIIASQFSEGFPRTIWEAMAHSLPVIATRVGSIPAYTNNAAELVEPRDINSIEEAVQKLIAQPLLRQTLIKNGQKLAKENTLEKRSMEMIKAMEQYLGNSGMKNKNRRIKVLHVAPLPPPLGGMVTYVQGLLNSDVFKTIDSDVVRLNFLNKEQYTGIVREIVNIINAIILTFAFFFKIITWRPNIVHIQSNSGLGFFEKSWIALLGKLFGRKTMMHVHGGNFREYYTLSSKLIKFMIKKCALINDQIITGSPQMRETWLYIGLQENRITYVGNAVNLPSEYLRNQHDFVSILFLTRVVLEKGILELIDAFLLLKKTHDNIRLRIVGADTLDTHIVKAYLSENDKNNLIQYIGMVSDEEKHQEYLEADIFAFPTYVEDQSYAIMEAMSYGLPCVASDVGGVPSLINNGENGILVKPKDVNSLTNALESLIFDPSLREQLGVNARKTIEEGFTWNKRSSEIIDLYNSILSKNT